MPKHPKVIPLFNWQEIFTTVAYCAFAGFLAGLSVGAYIAILGAVPTAALSILAFPICAIGGIVVGATLGLFYGIGASLLQGMKRSLQKNAKMTAKAAKEKPKSTHSSLNLLDNPRLYPNLTHKKSVSDPALLVEQGSVTPRRGSLSLAIKNAPILFPGTKAPRPNSVPSERRKGLLAYFK